MGYVNKLSCRVPTIDSEFYPDKSGRVLTRKTCFFIQYINQYRMYSFFIKNPKYTEKLRDIIFYKRDRRDIAYM